MNDTQSSRWLIGDNVEDRLDDIAYNDWVKRYSMQNVANIIVEGHEKRFAGQIIEIEWPSIVDELKNNEVMKGNFLIKSVTHSFEPGQTYFYKQRLVLLKNAYNNVTTDIDLLDAVNTNAFDVERRIRRSIIR